MKEIVSFSLSISGWQRKSEKIPEYLALHHAWKISKSPLPQ
jgi:hypothetical protein